MPNCFACRKWSAKSTTQKLLVCDACVEKADAIANISVPWTPFEKGTIHPDVAREGFGECWKNSRYTVFVRRFKNEYEDDVVHLSIKRNDKNPMHDWRDMQRVKNEILGRNEEAMELYPAEGRLMDTANQYHLWCFSGKRAPFGYECQRLVMEDVGSTGGKQRPFEQKPDDLASEEKYQEMLAENRKKQVTTVGYRGQIKALLDKATSTPDYGCQNPFRYTDNRKCETVKPEQPELWCGFCMAQLLKKLAIESGIIQG